MIITQKASPLLKIINNKFDQKFVFLHLGYHTLKSVGYYDRYRWKTKPKYKIYFGTLKKFDTLGAHTMQCMSRSIEPVKSFHRRYWDADWFQSIVMHGIVYATASEFFQSATKYAVLLFGFPPVAILIPNRFRCVISQQKENKFLLKFIID